MSNHLLFYIHKNQIWQKLTPNIYVVGGHSGVGELGVPPGPLLNPKIEIHPLKKFKGCVDFHFPLKSSPSSLRIFQESKRSFCQTPLKKTRAHLWLRKNLVYILTIDNAYLHRPRFWTNKSRDIRNWCMSDAAVRMLLKRSLQLHSSIYLLWNTMLLIIIKQINKDQIALVYTIFQKWQNMLFFSFLHANMNKIIYIEVHFSLY